MKTEIFEIKSSDDEKIQIAGKALREGKLVAIPTETVYGLAANALDEKAVRSIFAAKGRPSDNPLIVHISRLEQWDFLVEKIDERAKLLAEKFWPGPLTIILKKSDVVPEATSGGLKTVAVRMPSHPIARAIIEASGVPLAAPSANTSGKPSPTTAKHVEKDLFGKIDYIVNGGDCSVGVESTVITLATEKPTLLRPGGITPEMLEGVLGEIEISDSVFNKLSEDSEAASPGMKYQHYSPKAKIVIVKADEERYCSFLSEVADEKTVALCFEEDKEKLSFVKTVVYGKEKDSFSQASSLFDSLRQVDEVGAEIAYARFPEMSGVGLAVFNRLIRAAAFNIIEV
ncbi:MAG: threonylcarbamoyl-AMP synthase [Clostridia bacterium]|nr:threonylcarbamoyl-AMP synthase [Clostridia bacterium]